jgi:hypothetical protein
LVHPSPYPLSEGLDSFADTEEHRSYIHPTTLQPGKGFAKDDPHITISVKNPDTERAEQHTSSHGYTLHVNSFDVIKVKPPSQILKNKGSHACPQETETNKKIST